MMRRLLLAGATVLFLALVFTITAPRSAQARSLDFPDVPDTGPMHEAIQALADLDVISGYVDGRFRPFATLTRAQAAKMLVAWRQPVFEASTEATRSSAGTSRFTDLTSEQHALVSAAIMKGWVSGYPDGTFRPGKPLTRQQMATVIVRSLGLEAAAKTLTVYQVDDALDSFSDETRIAPAARPFVALVVRKGLMSGNNGRFDPLKPVTRAQFCLVLYRASSLPADALSAARTPVEQALVAFMNKQLFEPHDSPLTGEMVLQNAAWYGIPSLAQLVILAAETSFGDPKQGGTLARHNNFGCLRYGGSDTPWGELAEGSVWVAGKEWYSFADPAVGMAAFGRYLKAAKNGYFLSILQADRPDWGRFAAVYYGSTVPGFNAYVARLHSLEASLRERAAAHGASFSRL